MGQIAEGTLERRIADLESAVRALVAGGAVGGTAVAAADPSQLTLTGVINTSTLSAWGYNGPDVDLFVTAGRLLVQVAARLDIAGINTSLYMGYQVLGPAADQASLAGAAVAVAPDTVKSLSLQDHGAAQGTQGSISSFDLVTGLANGWYRVRSAYALGYTSQTTAPVGIATNRRLAVTRY